MVFLFWRDNMYVDTHCHLSSEDYDDIDLVIKENIDNNVSKIIVSGCDMESIKEGLVLFNFRVSSFRS